MRATCGGVCGQCAALRQGGGAAESARNGSVGSFCVGFSVI